MKKTQQYNILAELFRLNLINTKLLREISDNIEAVFHNESSHKIERWIGLAEIFEPNNQLKVAAPQQQMLDHMFGHRFVDNTFFKGLSMDCVAQLMKTCKQVQVNAGENIYNTNQISNGSRLG